MSNNNNISNNNNNGKNGGSNKNYHKLRLRDSLLNMLGEFVALNKSPEVRLSKTSQQFLLEAVREEKLDFKPRHVRSVSSNAALLRCPATGIDGNGTIGQQQSAVPPNTGICHSRRISLPVGPSPASQPSPPNGNGGRFSLLFPARMRKVAQADSWGQAKLMDQLQQQQDNLVHQQEHRPNRQRQISTEVISESDEESMEEQRESGTRTVHCIRM